MKLKKITAILFILLLVFNLYGYRLILNIMFKDAHKAQELLIDKATYNQADLIEVKIQLNLPYQQDDDEFERVYGEVEVDGNFYTYVKRKVENGILILKCLPNKEKGKLHDAGNKIMLHALGTNNDKPGDQVPNQLTKFFWGEYETIEKLTPLTNNNNIYKAASLYINAGLCSPYYDVVHQPPKC